MPDNRYQRTRRMILSRVLLAPFVIVMMVCTTLVYFFATYARDQVENELVRIASGQRRVIEQFLGERASDLQSVSEAYGLEQLRDREFLTGVFHRLQDGSKAFFDLGVFDREGNHLAYVGPYDLAGKNYSRAEWFIEVREKGLYVSDVFLGYRNIPHFVIAVRRDQGEGPWYLRATIDTALFSDLVESVRVGKTGEAYIVNREGVFQTPRRSGGRIMEPDPDFTKYLIGEQEISSFSAGPYLEQRHLYAVGPLSETDWVFVVREEIGDAYARLTRATAVAVVLIVAGGAVVVFIAFILASNMADQLSKADMENRQMKTQLIIAGKLAEVGEMSAGVAHEINNPLQVMKSEHAMIREVISEMENGPTPPDPRSMDLIKDSVDQIGIQIDRCKLITQGLLKFARKTETTMEQVSMQRFMPEVVAMIENRALVENVRLVQEIDPDLPPITGDRGQLQQVFLNLLNNALYALKQKESGEIRVSAGEENGFVSVSVADNGCGIDPGDMEKIFMPFFSTKPVGQGTGLGLSTAYGIVKGMGGEITVTSELYAGTVFTVRLPLASPRQRETRPE